MQIKDNVILLKTREEKNAYAREWKKRNPEKTKAHRRAYYLKHKEKKLAYTRKYQELNKEALYLKKAKWRVDNKEVLKAKDKEYRKLNKAKIQVGKNEWKKNNRGIVVQSGSYIKNMLRQGTNIAAGDIPQELVEAKRLQLQIKRYLKE